MGSLGYKPITSMWVISFHSGKGGRTVVLTSVSGMVDGEVPSACFSCPPNQEFSLDHEHLRRSRPALEIVHIDVVQPLGT